MTRASEMMTALPRVTVRVTPDRSVFIGETVTLKCEIENQYRSLNWRYRWSKGTQHYTENSDSLTIERVADSDQGRFSCSAVRDGRPQTSQSSFVDLTVQALPTTTVKVTPNSPVFTGETVNLTCNIEIEDQYRSLNWRYLWYKNTTKVLNSERYTVNRDSLTITKVNESDQDDFSCSAVINGPPQTLLSRSSVYLTVKGKVSRSASPVSPQQNISQTSDQIQSEDVNTPLQFERPTPQVFVWPADHVHRGETVHLICVINRGGVCSWQYSWYKDDSDIQQYEPYYTIRSFNESHAGKYTCRGTEINGSRYSDISNAVTLTVSGSSGLIVGVAVGLSVLLLIIFLVLLWWFKNKKGKVSQSPSAVSPQQNISQTSDVKKSEDVYTPLQFVHADIYDSIGATDNKDKSSDNVSESERR
ncbi:uncharacterized protein [Misgurnus anguillicaudatus]|uniref:uncharacterized protein n=1 Tax=Misgurnus anguillicaudatus TaxID=75329 RepID=UPI003CCFB79B